MYFTKGVEFQTWIRNYLYKGNPARFLWYLSFTGQLYSETFRSVKNFFFVFLQCAEAWKTSFLSFWNVQKHERSPFGLSEMFRSMKNSILAFLQCAEAWKISFLPFCSVQKHEKLLFGLSEMFRSMKNLHLVFLKRSGACFFPIFAFPRHA